MINLDAPGNAIQGDTIELSCHFQLSGQNQQLPSRTEPFFENQSKQIQLKEDNQKVSRKTLHDNPESSSLFAEREKLYAIKWYKDDREFFRFVAQDWPNKQVLPLDSIQVDLEKSNNRTVTIRNVTLKTSGLFKCEVSTDAPQFVSKAIERKLVIHSLPSSGPSIEIESLNSNDKSQLDHNSRNNKRLLFLGDQLELLCMSSQSKPAAQLSWLLNDKLNLSSPTGYNHKSMIEIKNQRFLQFPSNTTNQQSNSNVYEIVKENGTSVNLMPSFDPQRLPINLNDNAKIDQYTEISASRIKLKIDENFIKLSNNLTSRQINPNKFFGPTKETKQIGTSKNQNTKFQTKLACVSTVLNVNLSNEIKFQIINGTRLNQNQQEVAENNKGHSGEKLEYLLTNHHESQNNRAMRPSIDSIFLPLMIVSTSPIIQHTFLMKFRPLHAKLCR